MSNPMRFLADMGVSPLTVAWLNEIGRDATHLRNEGLQRLPDDQILLKAHLEKRILLTCDLDFGYLLAVGRNALPSVVLFRLSDMRPVTVFEHIQRVIENFSDELLAGAIVVVKDTSIRVRLLPIGEGID